MKNYGSGFFNTKSKSLFSKIQLSYKHFCHQKGGGTLIFVLNLCRAFFSQSVFRVKTY